MSNPIIPRPSGNDPLRFLFAGQPIRILKDENGEPLFVAADVCKALDLTNISQALSRLDEDEKSSIILNDVTGENRSLVVITEPGLYSLIMTSRKQEAKDFKRWVVHEVIPAVRKMGIYQSPNMTPLQRSRALLEIALANQEALEQQQQQLDSHAERITSLEAHVQSDVEYFSVIGYFRKLGLPAPTLNEAQSIGQRAARLSCARSYGIGKTADPRFGEVNTYHEDILKEVIGH